MDIKHHTVLKLVLTLLMVLLLADLLIHMDHHHQQQQLKLLKLVVQLLKQIVYNKVLNMLQLVVFIMILIHKLFDEQQSEVQ